MLRVLGRHEELTLYAAVALARQSDDPELELWRLAQGVDGWGRIQIVERLAGTERPEIKDVAPARGFRNSVMDEYTAYTAATTGDLVAALEGPVDDELLAGAVGILRALLAGGPAQDIGDYAEGPRALRMVLERVRSNAHDGRAGAARARRHHAARQRRPGARPGAALDARRAVSPPARSPGRCWPTRRGPRVVEAGLGRRRHVLDGRRPRPAGRHRHVPGHPRAAPPRPVRRLLVAGDAACRRDPAAATCSPSPTRTSTASELGTGPALETGFGPMYRRHSALETLVTGLERFPGAGWPHVRTALASPVVRSRNMALRTLAAWGPGGLARRGPAGAGRGALGRARRRRPAAHRRGS